MTPTTMNRHLQFALVGVLLFTAPSMSEVYLRVAGSLMVCIAAAFWIMEKMRGRK